MQICVLQLWRASCAPVCSVYALRKHGGLCKTLHGRKQILTGFRNLKSYYNSLIVPCNVVEICILVDK